MSLTAGTEFGMAEYLVVLAMLLFSVLIGLYYTFWSKQDSYHEYMLAGRKMGVFPVAMSMVASNISGLALVGTPAEAYSYGTLYSSVLVTDIIVPVINICLFLPVFYNLQLNSVNEYLGLRFSKGTQVLGSMLFTISQLIYLPAIIYVPALVFNQVSGYSVGVVAFIISAVCIFYTTIGGLKAVLWTDALQNVFSLAAILFILYLGVDSLGGVARIFQINEEGGRLEFFNMDPSPFVRGSFWSMNFGSLMMWLVYLAIHPGAVQRSMSVPTMADAKQVLVWSTVGVMFIHATTVFMGMILYGRYHGCDPVATGDIKKTGQLLPLYVMEVTKGYTGLAGLFVSGVLSAALSSMSAAFNTMAGAMYEDIVEPFLLCGMKQSDLRQSIIMKILSMLIGCVCVALTLAVDKTDSIFQIGMSLTGVTNGPLLTLFILGIFCPRANAKGVIVGAICSLVGMSWIAARAQYYIAIGLLKYPAKHTSVHLCPNIEVKGPLETYRGYSSPVIADPSVPLIYQLSYMYYTLCGTLIGVIVGMVVSWTSDPPVLTSTDRKLFSPLVHHLLPFTGPSNMETELEPMKGKKDPVLIRGDTVEGEVENES